MDRHRVIEAVRTAIERDVAALERMLLATRDEATSSESRQENKYDTRALEASYLAAGQGRRLLELQRLAAWAQQLDPTSPDRVRLGAAVLIEDDDTERWVFVAPSVGPEVVVDGQGLTIISTESPLGRQLLGLEADDALELQDRELVVLEIV